MPRPRLNPEERTRRRREAALRAAETRRAKQAEAEVASEPEAPTAREILAHAQAIGREADLWRRAHELHCPFRADQWNPRQRLALAAMLGLVRRETP